MTQEQIDAIPRKNAKDVYRDTLDKGVLAIEVAMNLEWWRGYHAALRQQKR